MKPADRINAIVMIASMAGISWLLFNYFYIDPITKETYGGGCIIRHFTGIPCPSCGITRALILIVNGNCSGALLLNPFSFIVGGIMALAPVWIACDLITHKESFFTFYRQMEIRMGKKYIALSFIGLVVVNWIWNIYKGI